LNLPNITPNQLDGSITIRLNASEFSRDFPFGGLEYIFAVKVTDENGTGVSSYAPVRIDIMVINEKALIPRVRYSILLTSLSCSKFR
jgi:hypothetical protein